jgi:phosphoribosylformimino-5-aminoimidazole carboxamide ribotide isomerase
MNEFIIYPAIDLRKGKVVRLKQGSPDRQTEYSNSPSDAARDWVSQGADWLHIVNLDGAFGDQATENQKAIKEILSTVKEKIQIQFGGGLRNMDQIQQAIKGGVSRVVLGTAVIEDPSFAKKALDAFGGERIAFGLDAMDQKLMSRGWQSDPGLDVFVLAEKLAEYGANTLIYTNILKDGMETGVDWEIASDIAQQTGLEVIASGGTESLKDIQAVRTAGLAGVIVGRALYEGNFTLKEAIDVG